MPNIGAAYFWLCLVKGGRELQRHALDDWMEEGQRSLGVLEKHLGGNRFLAGEHYSIADIALYAYTHLARCDFELAPFPACARGSTGSQPNRVMCRWRSIPRRRDEYGG